MREIYCSSGNRTGFLPLIPSPSQFEVNDDDDDDDSDDDDDTSIFKNKDLSTERLVYKSVPDDISI